VPHDISRILVIRPGALGDVLLTLPALQALQDRFPEAAIEVLGNYGILQLLLGRSVVAAVSSFDRADLAALFQADAIPDIHLQRYLQQFDLIISYATPSDHVFAHNLTRIARGRVLSHDVRPTRHLHRHMSEHLLQPLRKLGVAVRAEAPRLTLTATDQRDAAQWWKEYGLDGQLVVAVHPGSGSTAKNWPAVRFATVAQSLIRECGARILLLRGPADADAVAEVQQALNEEEYILLQDLPLHRLAAIVARCRAYLGNDSGVSHLAAAVGTPTVAIFGPTDAAVWAPRGKLVRVLRGTTPCAPCSLEQRSDCRQRLCLESISVRTVLGMLQEVIGLDRHIQET